MTLFVHKQTGELHPDTQALFIKVADKIEKNGIEAWFEADIEDFLGADAKDYDKTTDTLDVWFDSGVSHSITNHQFNAFFAPVRNPINFQNFPIHCITQAILLHRNKPLRRCTKNHRRFMAPTMRIGLQYNLPVECPVDSRGVFFEDTELLAGQFIFKANASVIEILENCTIRLFDDQSKIKVKSFSYKYANF
jgi:isoleucyl-tRNA synthetase